MRIPFVKMHGLGNDFVVIDGVTQSVRLDRSALRLLADRHEGVGCDQVLIIEPSPSADVDFRYRIYNADGGEVEQCGNGARCVARFVREQGLSDKKRIRVATTSGVIGLTLETGGQVTVDMGIPSFRPADLPMRVDGPASSYEIDIDGRPIRIGAVSMGNPHAVLEVEDVEAAPVAELGPRIGTHPVFPQGANVGFVQVVDPHALRLRVFERGVGETRACGSGACAAVAWMRVAGRLASHADTHLRGGVLRIQWEGQDQSLYMTGPAVRVFDGTIET